MDERVVKSLEELVKVQKIAKDGVLSLDGAVDDLKNQLSDCLAEIQEAIELMRETIERNHCHLMLPVVWIWEERLGLHGEGAKLYTVFVGEKKLKTFEKPEYAKRMKAEIEEAMGQ